jgi:flagellar basal-body rod protein FlgG
MVRSLWTAATGMNGQQANIDTVANNLANVNTTGYKKQRVEFEDLLYQTVRTAGTPATEDTITPVGVQMGHGAKVASTLKMFDQGSLQNTGNISDIAIQGEGFFRVLQYDGTYAYSRDGSFKIDSERQLVTSNGLKALPEITFPEGYRQDTVNVSQDGRVTVRVADLDDPVDVGQVELYRFQNPAGLSSAGDNLFKQTPASGNSIAGRPGFEGFGKTIHKFLEMSNVSTVSEMVSMIVAQRAYEFNSKAIQTSDSMLGTAASLKR